LLLSSSSFAASPDPETLARQVTIRRTEYGVPHILADNYRALGFGFGYAQAEDHLHSIMRLILAARGELSQHFGAAEKNANLESDFENLRYRYHARASDTYDQLGQDWRDMTEGFAAGLNFYIAKHRAELEDWIQPVTPQDITAHGLAGIGRFAFDRSNLSTNFAKKMEKGKDAVVEPEGDTGSNLWAFDGTRTKSGKAILLANPHQPWSPVSTYYEAHLTLPGKLNLYGSTFVGRPVLTTGFNDNLGWTHTVNYPDIEEIYALDKDPDRAGYYLFDNQSVPIETAEYTVLVREVVEVEEPVVTRLSNEAVPNTAGRILSGAGEGGVGLQLEREQVQRLREETRSYSYTPLGPVIYETADQVFVLKSVTWEQFQAYEQWFELGHAKNLAEFQNILRTPRIPMFNIGYADREGNIWYVSYGTFPDMPHRKQDTAAVHARGAADVWMRTHPFEDLPQVLNPKGGYVMNSNSAPYFANLYEPMDRFAYPAHFEDNRFSLRSQHSMFLIHNDEKFSLEDVVRIKHSQRAVLGERVRDDLVRIVRETQPTGDLRDGMKAVAAWDLTTAQDSRGGVLFDFWWRAYAKDSDGTGQDNFAMRWLTSNPLTTPAGLRDEARALACFEQAVREVKQRYGALDVPWGDVHRLRQADGTDLPIGGSENYMGSFRIVRYRDDADGKRKAYSGDSWVLATEFGDTPRAYSVLAYSQSEYPDSPHFSDQAALYTGEKMKPVRFTEADIKANLATSYRPGQEPARARATTD